MRNHLFTALFTLLIVSAVTLAHGQLNLSPTIGVLTIPSDFDDIAPPTEYSYIADAYIKWIESAGARVVPIAFDLDHQTIRQLVDSVNGLLLPGGGPELWNEDWSITHLQETANYLVQLAKEVNDNGTYFPVWGTCLGFEMLTIAIANDSRVMGNFNDTYQLHNQTVLAASNGSKLFKNMPKNLFEWNAHDATMYFNHHYGVGVDTFHNNKNLNDFYRLMTYSYDMDGASFVSTIEARDYPIYGVQHHPEKSAFVWREEIPINHTPEAIAVAQYYANFFVQEARKNNRKFVSKEAEYAALIYRHKSHEVSESFMECYFFKNTNATHALEPGHHLRGGMIYEHKVATAK
jgi:gamma-glutamyl hydrolase